MNNLGRLYYDGHYDDQEDVQDRQKASEWFRRAAGVSEHETCTLLPEPTRSSAHSGPVPDALYNLGQLYDDRERNVNAANAAEARCWYEMAAIAGHTAAMLKLGSIYEAGRGVEQNVAEAIKWYEKAAKNKDMEGMFNLAALSEAGRGIAPDRGGGIDLVCAGGWRRHESGVRPIWRRLGPQNRRFLREWLLRAAGSR